MSNTGEITHAAILAAVDRCAAAADYGVAYRIDRLPGNLPAAITFATRRTVGLRMDDRAFGEVRGVGYTVEDAEAAFMASLAEWEARPDEEDRRRGALIDAALAAMDAGEPVSFLEELADGMQNAPPPPGLKAGQ